MLTREIKFLLATGNETALLSAGYSAADVLSAGYSAAALRSAGYSAADVLSAGYSAADVLSAGYSAADVLSAGYSAAALRSAGYSAAALRSAGYSAAALLSAGYSAADVPTDDDIPLVENPYSRLLADINAKKRLHDQSIFGPECEPAANLCNTRMCTAGHLVSMAGPDGWKLKAKYGFIGAAALIHYRAHPNEPCQDFGSIPQDWAMAYIETMAEKEMAAAKEIE